ncbi:ATPase, T2SS/T4P/T4SS family [Thermodesulfobacteriota bacterium]
MSDVNGNAKIDIDPKIKEAEMYSTQGLHSEALEIYEEILTDFPELDPDTRSAIAEKIDLIKKEIDELEQEDPEISTEDLSLLKKSWVTEEGESVLEILDSASALKELGLFKEAVDELKKLFDHDYPTAKIIPELSECLFEIHSPSRVIDQIEKIINEKDLSDAEKADIYFSLGMEMENKNHADLALEFYEAVQTIDPEYDGIQTQIGLIQSSRTFDSRYGYLLESKIVTTSQLQNALALSKKTNKSVEFVLMDQTRIDRQEIGKSLSYFYNCPFITFDPDREVPYELLSKLKQAFLIQNSWAPLNWEMTTKTVEIVIDDPSDLMKTDHISVLMKTKNIKYFVGIKEDITEIIKYFYKGGAETTAEAEADSDEDFDMIPDIDFEEEDEVEEYTDEVDESSSQIVRMVDQVLISAYRKGVSDIHIEPSPITKKLGIRFRVDGVCQDFIQLPVINSRAMLSRLKILSGLDIAERRLPQDGKIKFKRKGIKPFELRLATLPTVGGFEDAVLRILAESGAMQLDDMGLNERTLTILKDCVAQPYGLVLVVGPTGSGKTTTLHSALGYINKPGVKIWTAEDPVEITQAGLRQVQCQSKIGLDFARVMRAFLRADPDIIMIGEMRDEETASIGVEASLTGHLVFSTLHTNSAPETVTRLLDMGLNPLNFSDAFLCVLAQRLARRLCKKCRQEYNPSEDEIEEIIKTYGADSFEDSGIQLTTETVLYRTEGCDACSGTGYKGRLGIHELMEGTPEIKRMIKKESPSEELFAQAAKDGMTTLIQDGIVKSLGGITDAIEIRRVCAS